MIRPVGIVMNGVTGRMGATQHLGRSIMAIRRQGGVRCADGDVLMPEPVLLGRNEARLRALAEQNGLSRWTTDLDAALSLADCRVYFDAQTTALRPAALRRAIAAGKAVYCEKPPATTGAEAAALADAAAAAGVPNGVVRDKLYLPGLLRLRGLLEGGFFGRVLAVRGEFGYWVFEGDRREPQRPSWNYRAEDGGGIILDMFCHWHYLLGELFGEVRAVCCLGATLIPRRWDEQGRPYDCTAEDAAWAIFELEGGIVARFDASWATRVRRDDLLTIQVDGTEGSAVATLRDCFCQSYDQTPRPVWDPDADRHLDYFADWSPVQPDRQFDDAFKVQWEAFLRHAVKGEPYGGTLRQAARGVLLAEKAIASWRRRRWVELPGE